MITSIAVILQFYLLSWNAHMLSQAHAYSRKIISYTLFTSLECSYKFIKTMPFDIRCFRGMKKKYSHPITEIVMPKL